MLEQIKDFISEQFVSNQFFQGGVLISILVYIGHTLKDVPKRIWERVKRKKSFKPSQMKTNIYTDGSCNNHTKNKGGIGFVCEFEERKVLYEYYEGSYTNTTSNRMELLAICRAMEHIINYPEKFDSVTIHSDSQYVINSINKGWLYRWESEDFKGRKNADLWRLFLKLQEKLPCVVKFKWVRGHNGNKLNEIADGLASQGAQMKEKRDTGNF